MGWAKFWTIFLITCLVTLFLFKISAIKVACHCFETTSQVALLLNHAT
jgi:hypothetical protein